MPTYIALLRAVNVGGTGKLPMTDLKKMCVGAGFENVARGQWEASTALNLSTWTTFRDIIIPQAIPPIVPALGNYLVALFKETPLLSAIAVLELMQTAKILGSETFRYNEPITLVGSSGRFMGLLSPKMRAGNRLRQNYCPRHEGPEG